MTAVFTRLATLAESGRIGVDLVAAEIQRLRWLWQREAADTTASTTGLAARLGAERWDALDLFDQLQLQAVADVCRESSSLSDAGRRLFHRSRTQRQVVNDADRLRKYLLKHGLSWELLQG